MLTLNRNIGRLRTLSNFKTMRENVDMTNRFIFILHIFAMFSNQGDLRQKSIHKAK